MNPSQYLQSRWVTSQISLNKKQSTSGHAESHAILAHMWITLKLATAYHILLIAAHYVAVLCRFVRRPRPAMALAQDERERTAKMKAEADKIAKDIMQGALKARADDGLDSLPRQGTA